MKKVTPVIRVKIMNLKIIAMIGFLGFVTNSYYFDRIEKIKFLSGKFYF